MAMCESPFRKLRVCVCEGGGVDEMQNEQAVVFPCRFYCAFYKRF